MDLNNSGFYCMITGEIMTDPVIDPDGHSYEKSAILQWLRIKSLSPITKKRMTPTDLRPNRALQTTIEEMIAAEKNLRKEASPMNSSGEDVRDRPSPPELSITVTAKNADAECADPLCPPGILLHSRLLICSASL